MYGWRGSDEGFQTLVGVTLACQRGGGRSTYRVVAVLEAHVLNHDNRRGNLPTGRKIK